MMKTVEFVYEEIIDLAPNRQAYNPGFYPMRATTIEYYDEDDWLDKGCPECGSYFSIKAGLFKRLQRQTGNWVVCYRCYCKQFGYRQTRLMAYLAGQESFIDE